LAPPYAGVACLSFGTLSLTLTGGATVAPSYGADDWLFDTLVGLRFGQVVSRHWGHRLEADVSTGGTDYTWSVAPALRYV